MGIILGVSVSIHAPARGATQVLALYTFLV